MFFPLLFAHLVADFILQPSQLIHWKFKSWKGVAAHASVHFMSYILVFLPYIFEWKIWAVGGMIALSHFFVDCWKIKHELMNKHYVQSFVTDQLLHFSFLGISVWLMGESFTASLSGLYTSKLLWISLSAVLIVSFVVEVFLYQFDRQNTNAPFKPHYVALFIRGAALAMICFGLFLLGVHF